MIHGLLSLELSHEFTLIEGVERYLHLDACSIVAFATSLGVEAASSCHTSQEEVVRLYEISHGQVCVKEY